MPLALHNPTPSLDESRRPDPGPADSLTPEKGNLRRVLVGAGGLALGVASIGYFARSSNSGLIDPTAEESLTQPAAAPIVSNLGVAALPNRGHDTISSAFGWKWALEPTHFPELTSDIRILYVMREDSGRNDSGTGPNIKLIPDKKRAEIWVPDFPESKFRLAFFDASGSRIVLHDRAGDVIGDSVFPVATDSKSRQFVLPSDAFVSLGVEHTDEELLAQFHEGKVNAAKRAEALGLFVMPPVGVGEKVDFTLPTKGENKQNITAADLRGKIVIVDTWASWCGACLHIVEPELKHVYAEHPEDIVVISVNFDDLPERIEKLAQPRFNELPSAWFKVSVAKDPGHKALWEQTRIGPPEFGRQYSLPDFWIIDRDGTLVFHGTGAQKGIIETEVAKLLEQNPIVSSSESRP